jgi:glyoxylate reductase
VLTDATADLAWALILSAARRVIEADRYMRAGLFTEWRPDLLLGSDVAGKTLGVIGAGRIGKAVAERSGGFRMRVLYSSRRVHPDLDQIGGRRVELDELLCESDFVTIHVPLSPETRHLIGPREFDLMKPPAILINTSRGPVVDETALVEALRTGRIAGAGLDVYENEPQIAEGLAGLDNVTLLPHLGSATVETRNRMAVLAAENVIAALDGRMPPSPVNPEALKSPTS